MLLRTSVSRHVERLICMELLQPLPFKPASVWAESAVTESSLPPSLDPAALNYAVRDRYVARLLDLFDLLTAAYRLGR